MWHIFVCFCFSTEAWIKKSRWETPRGEHRGKERVVKERRHSQTQKVQKMTPQMHQRQKLLVITATLYLNTNNTNTFSSFFTSSFTLTKTLCVWCHWSAMQMCLPSVFPQHSDKSCSVTVWSTDHWVYRIFDLRIHTTASKTPEISWNLYFPFCL